MALDPAALQATCADPSTCACCGDAAHIISDLHFDVTSQRRAIKAALQLLTDAAHALSHGSPHVTADHLDRVIANLTKTVTEEN